MDMIGQDTAGVLLWDQAASDYSVCLHLGPKYNKMLTLMFEGGVEGQVSI